MFTTFKLKVLHKLLGWFLGFYDPHHDLEARGHIDFTRGQVYLFIRDKYRRNFKKQTWHCQPPAHHDRNCPHIVTVKWAGVKKKKTILNIKSR